MDSEVLSMFELGLKSDWLDHLLRVNAALYYYDCENLQVNRNATAGSAGPIKLVVETAGDAEILGLEADINWNISQQLSLMAGFNIIDTEFTDYDQATANVWDSSGSPAAPIATTAPYDASGSSLPQVSETSVYIAVEYRFALSHASMPLSLNYSYKEGYDYDLIAKPAVLTSSKTALDEMSGDDIKLLNARLAYLPHQGPWQLALWAKKLTDEEYCSEVVGFTTGIRASLGTPRISGADVSYHF